MAYLLIAGVCAALFAVSFLAVRRAALEKRGRERARLDAELNAIRVTGIAEAARTRSDHEAAIREERLSAGQKLLAESAERAKLLERREDELAKKSSSAAAAIGKIAAREQALGARDEALKKFDDE